MNSIFHLDMDAFFVSVEELFDPSLRGKPVVVGGKGTERGVVSAASYAARKFGVHSAMPLRTAYSLCPQAIFLPGNPERYRHCSQQVYEVLQRFTPLISMASIDEGYLDMSGTERLHGPPLRAAHALHQAIKQATGLNCSIGASSSRLVSKIASDQAKPNGVLWIPPGAEAEFLAPLDIRKVPGVGKATEARLRQFGIRKVGDLAALDAKFVMEQFGNWGMALAGKAKGLDSGGWFDSAIGEQRPPKSISHEHTFPEDLVVQERLEITLAHLSEKVARRLREHALFARTIQIKLRYEDFSTFTRATSLATLTQLDTEIFATARELFRANWRVGHPIRLVGVQASNLEAHAGQSSLLDGPNKEKLTKLMQAADQLRDRFGKESIVSLAIGMKGSFQERVHENPAALPGKGPKKPE